VPILEFEGNIPVTPGYRPTVIEDGEQPPA
jgi:hypothetical protein